MSMKIRGDTNTQPAATSLTQNQTQAEKVFRKLSTGMKIVTAGDNAADWAISERMRNLIRAFSQDDQNVQNGSALVRTAERAIDQIVSNLRLMKELAIDAANDSNTDADRAVIQKEMDQHIAIVNDIALGTQYNGKYLLNGMWSDEGIRALNDFLKGVPITDLVANFVAMNGTDSPYRRSFGNPNLWATEVDKSFTGIGARLDFTGLQRKHAYAATIHNQGFTILCAGCPQYINIRFDASKTADESEFDDTPNEKDGVINDFAGEFIIGVQGVRNGDELAAALFEGVKTLSDADMVRNDYSPTFNGYNNDNPNGYYSHCYSSFVNTDNEVLLDANHQLKLLRDPTDPSKVYITRSGGIALQFKAGLVANEDVAPLDDIDFPDFPINPLQIQHGAEAGQHINIFINEMSANMLGISDVSVRTIDDASSAIAKIDNAITYSLNEATNMGAYLQRLERIALNVTTQNENVQAAESTLRDADMAKEMTDYMRANILTQSAQAMLAQANQTDGAVLGLIR